jgi:hypothetical protein
VNLAFWTFYRQNAGFTKDALPVEARATPSVATIAGGWVGAPTLIGGLGDLPVLEPAAGRCTPLLVDVDG